MNNNTRIELTDSLHDSIVKLSDGNPGGLTAMVSMVKVAEETDPDAAFGLYGPLLNLDTFGIYGSRIWMLFKDVCRENPRHAIACLRSVQMGLLSEDSLNKAIDGKSRLDIENVLLKLSESLPNFKAG